MAYDRTATSVTQIWDILCADNNNYAVRALANAILKKLNKSYADIRSDGKATTESGLTTAGF